MNPYQLGIVSSFACPPDNWNSLHLFPRICHFLCRLLRFRFWLILVYPCPLIGLNENGTIVFPLINHPFIFIWLFTAFLKPYSNRWAPTYSNSLSMALLDFSTLVGGWYFHFTQLTSKILRNLHLCLHQLSPSHSSVFSLHCVLHPLAPPFPS